MRDEDDDQEVEVGRAGGRTVSRSLARTRRTEGDRRRRAAEAQAAKPEAVQPADWLSATALELVQGSGYTLLYDKFILGLPTADLMKKYGLRSQTTLKRRVDALLGKLRAEL